MIFPLIQIILIFLRAHLSSECTFSLNFLSQTQSEQEESLKNTFLNQLLFNGERNFELTPFYEHKNAIKVKFSDQISSNLMSVMNMDLKQVKSILRNPNPQVSMKKRRNKRRSISFQGSTVKKTTHRKSKTRCKINREIPKDEMKDIIKSSKDLFGDCDEKISKNEDYIHYLQQYRQSRLYDDFDTVSVSSGSNLKQFGSSQAFQVRTSKSPMLSKQTYNAKP